jgi:prevent-host-death family protein
VITATVFEAKTKLSHLLKQVQKGEVVIITSGREKTPVARLESVQSVPKKRLGARLKPGFVLSQKFFAPLPDEELALWDGGAE